MPIAILKTPKKMWIKRFEDIIAWQKAQDLAVEVYSVFKNVKYFGFRDQITRASVSISNNIEEGFDRGIDADFIRFLNFARTSCNEVKSMAYLAYRLDYITKEVRDQFLERCEEESKIILGRINSLNKPQK